VESVGGALRLPKKAHSLVLINNLFAIPWQNRLVVRQAKNLDQLKNVLFFSYFLFFRCFM